MQKLSQGIAKVHIRAEQLFSGPEWGTFRGTDRGLTRKFWRRGTTETKFTTCETQLMKNREDIDNGLFLCYRKHPCHWIRGNRPCGRTDFHC